MLIEQKTLRICERSALNRNGSAISWLMEPKPHRSSARVNALDWFRCFDIQQGELGDDPPAIENSAAAQNRASPDLGGVYSYKQSETIAELHGRLISTIHGEFRFSGRSRKR